MANSASFSRLTSANMNFRNSKRRTSQTTLLDAKGFASTSSRVKTMSLLPLEEMVTCPIDFNFLDDPRLLPCGHVFCCQCLNGYLKQLLIQNEEEKKNPDNSNVFLPCPICRMRCSIPDNGLAESLPKAFNHTLILDYIKGLNRPEPTSSKNSYVNFSRVASQNNGLATPSPICNRKNSILVKSDMLNSLVNDISAMQRCGSNSYLDQAIILTKVQKLIQQIPTSNSNSTANKESDINLSSIPDPSAPYFQNRVNNSPAKNARGSSSVRCNLEPSKRNIINGPNQIDSTKNGTLPRFNTTAECSIHEINSAVEQVHEEMRRAANYKSLKKNYGCEVLPEFSSTIADVQLIPDANNTNIWRYTIACSGNDDILHFWRKKLLQTEFSHLKSNQRCEYQKIRLDLTGLGNIKVQYVRFFKKLIFITGILSRDSDSGDNKEISPDLIDPGIVLCAALPESLIDEDTEDSNQTTSSDFNEYLEKFPIIGRSCLFLRDSVGMTHPDRPTISGLDIDKSTGDIYIALCANAMICRLNQNNLKVVEREWFIDGPELSPSYICLAKSQHEVWASCPLNGKVFILDLNTDMFHHFTPDVSFGIDPSHIIYTSDNKIFLLDTKLSRIFWFQKVYQTICTQRIDHSLKERKTRGIEIIQPIDDSSINSLMELNDKSLLSGGIMCADKLGSYVVYPRSVLCKKMSQFCCA